MNVAETERLRVRWLNAGDSAFILELVNEPSWIQFIGEKGVRTPQDAVRYIENGPVAMYERTGFGLYMVELREIGEPIGICGLIKREGLKDVDLGFAFLPRFWRNGYAFESASAVMSYGRNVLGLRRIVAILSQDNHRSSSCWKNWDFVSRARSSCDRTTKSSSYMRLRAKLAVIVRAVPVLSIVGMVGCTSPGISSAPVAAASGVARADAGKGLRESRIIPLKSMAGDVEILYGDPEVAGEPFVMRIRELPGTIVPPHSHPVDENITVVEGTWYFGLGEEYKAETLQELKAGSYAFAPKSSTMFGYSATGAIVQVHGVGPFRIHWHGGLHTLGDPDAKSVFRFARGARVMFKSQIGRVAEGYASGKIIQYEIEASDGQRFMASEHELQPQ